MRMSFNQQGLAGMLAGLSAINSGSVGRLAGKATGAGADRIAKRVEQSWSARGWGDTSEVRPRRSAHGADDPRAYVIVEGGAAWREDHPSNPDPTLRPAADAEASRIERDIADQLEGLF